MAFEPPRIRAEIIGTVVADAEEKFNGTLHELRIAVNQSKKDKDTGEWVDNGATYVTYAGSGEYGEALKAFHKGAQVKITDAKVETRTYPRKDGSEGIQITARFGEIEETAPPKGAAESAW
jgi:hypothetical protein